MNPHLPAKPAVSVVTATRERPDWLGRALTSIREQSFTDFEAVVVDDGSSERTREAYVEIWRGLDARFVLHTPTAAASPGRGPGPARNDGLRLARGRYLAFMDDDDRWIAPDHLELAVRVMDEHGVDLYITNMRGECDGKVLIGDWFPGCASLTRGRLISDSPQVRELSLADLMRAMHRHYPHPSGIVFRRSLLGEIDPLWDRAEIGEDVDFMFRLADRAGRLAYRPDAVVGFNVTPRSSAYTRVAPVMRSMAFIAAAQHARRGCRRGIVRRAARATEAWHLRIIAKDLREQGRPLAAASFAMQSLCLYPRLGAAAGLASCMLPRKRGGAAGACRNGRPSS